MSFTISVENTRQTVRSARWNRLHSPDRAIRSRRLSWEAIEDRILLAGLTAFVDPDPAPGNQFGAAVVVLSTGNVVVTAPDDNAGGTGAGAVYLFNGTTGALISTLIGSHAGDNIGSGGVTALADGNYVVESPNWTNGAAADLGAVTWGSGTAGASGPVSATNSLVGSTANDSVGSSGVAALPDGNYVVDSPTWSNGAAANAGAVTWGSGTAGVSGPVSATNSLVGSTAGDSVGGNGVTALSNGNYVVDSPTWTNGAAASAGAVTWGSGTAGISGPISATNSLVGSTANDQVGGDGGSGDSGDGVTALSNGNYVVNSPDWTDAAAAVVGAVTWGSGTAGVSGPVSATNSLVGSTDGDSVGFGVTALSNGNYVVSSPFWTNGAAASAGAVTWGSGTAGVSGAVSAENSLVGSTANDDVGGGAGDGVTALTNGNYVVTSPGWTNGAAASAGAVTWGSGTAGVSGPVSATNSLVGSTANDSVGTSVMPLSNGSYVVSSLYWNNAAGAATWGSGTAGVSGPVSVTNSLVGSSANDSVGNGGVTPLSNGNYVVDSPTWTNGAAANAGAVTWGSGTAGVSGPVSATNSLVGSTANDSVGFDIGFVTALSNGNYVVDSPGWTNGAAASVGAVTWGSGTAGVSGPVSATNSLVGTTANDQVGFGGVTPLSNGNYVVTSPDWNNGPAGEAGAVTWGSGTAGVSGPVSATNSLVDSTANDDVGNSVIALSNGNYVVDSSTWANGTAADAGAVTWGSGTAGISGPISATNSLVGSTANEYVGGTANDNIGSGNAAVNYGGVTALSNGNYVVSSPNWNNGAWRGHVGQRHGRRQRHHFHHE